MFSNLFLINCNPLLLYKSMIFERDPITLSINYYNMSFQLFFIYYNLINVFIT